MLLPFPPDCEGLHPSLSVTSPSLPLPPSISSALSVLRASSLYRFTQRSILPSSISGVSSLCHWSSLQIAVAVYRWLVICPGVIMNPGQDPDRRLLSPRLLVHLCKHGLARAIHLHFQTFGVFWRKQLCFLCLQNPNPYNLLKNGKNENCPGPGLTVNWYVCNKELWCTGIS